MQRLKYKLQKSAVQHTTSHLILTINNNRYKNVSLFASFFRAQAFHDCRSSLNAQFQFSPFPPCCLFQSRLSDTKGSLEIDSENVHKALFSVARERYGKINDGKQATTSIAASLSRHEKKMGDKGKNKRIKKRNREKLTVRCGTYWLLLCGAEIVA